MILIKVNLKSNFIMQKIMFLLFRSIKVKEHLYKRNIYLSCKL